MSFLHYAGNYPLAHDLLASLMIFATSTEEYRHPHFCFFQLLFSMKALLLLFCFVGIAIAGQDYRAGILAGTGEIGFSGDGGPASKAKLNQPFGVVKGPDGAFYVCDVGNHAVRRIDPDGTISTVAGVGEAGYSGDGGLAPRAKLREPYEVRFDEAGNLYFVEMKNHIVRMVDAKTGFISTIAGTGRPGFSGDGGPATMAEMMNPHSIQFGRDGRLYVCDIGNHRIRVIDFGTGLISTFSGTGQRKTSPDGSPVAGASLHGPRALDRDSRGDLWLALREGNAVFRLDMKAKLIRHVAGTGSKGFSGNGDLAKKATLSGPKGIAVGPNGNVFLADTESHTVRFIDLKTGRMELLAGNGRKGNGPPIGDALDSRMNRLHGIYVDNNGSVFVGDTNNHVVRVFRPRN